MHGAVPSRLIFLRVVVLRQSDNFTLVILIIEHCASLNVTDKEVLKPMSAGSDNCSLVTCRTVNIHVHTILLTP
jgi:hypothetical protein